MTLAFQYSLKSYKHNIKCKIVNVPRKGGIRRYATRCCFIANLHTSITSISSLEFESVVRVGICTGPQRLLGLWMTSHALLIRVCCHAAPKFCHKQPGLSLCPYPTLSDAVRASLRRRLMIYLYTLPRAWAGLDKACLAAHTDRLSEVCNSHCSANSALKSLATGSANLLSNWLI